MRTQVLCQISSVSCNGSFYPCGSTAAGVLWDVSGNGRHLVYAGGACGSGKEYGSDYINTRGFTLADGTQYANNTGTAALNNIPIPALLDGSGACSWSWDWELLTINNEALLVDGDALFVGA